eukprot:262000_1
MLFTIPCVSCGMSSELSVSSGSSGVCNTLLLVGDVVVSFFWLRIAFHSFCFANSSHFDCVLFVVFAIGFCIKYFANRKIDGQGLLSFLCTHLRSKLCVFCAVSIN